MLHYLVERGCDYAQGYLLGKPSTADAATVLMSQRYPQA